MADSGAVASSSCFSSKKVEDDSIAQCIYCSNGDRWAGWYLKPHISAVHLDYFPVSCTICSDKLPLDTNTLTIHGSVQHQEQWNNLRFQIYVKTKDPLKERQLTIFLAAAQNPDLINRGLLDTPDTLLADLDVSAEETAGPEEESKDSTTGSSFVSALLHTEGDTPNDFSPPSKRLRSSDRNPLPDSTSSDGIRPVSPRTPKRKFRVASVLKLAPISQQDLEDEHVPGPSTSYGFLSPVAGRLSSAVEAVCTPQSLKDLRQPSRSVDFDQQDDDNKSVSSSGSEELGIQSPLKTSPDRRLSAGKDPVIKTETFENRDICAECKNKLGGTVVCPGLDEKMHHVKMHFGYKTPPDQDSTEWNSVFESCFLEAALELQLAKVCEIRFNSSCSKEEKKKESEKLKEKKRKERLMVRDRSGRLNYGNRKKERMGVNKYQCDICWKPLSSHLGHKLHMIRVHGAPTKSKLPQIPPMGTTRKIKWESSPPQQEHSDSSTTASPDSTTTPDGKGTAGSTGTGKHKCSFCDLSFIRFQDLLTHEERHSV